MLTHINDFLFIDFDEVLHITESEPPLRPFVEIRFKDESWLVYENNDKNKELIKQLFIKASEYAKKSPD